MKSLIKPLILLVCISSSVVAFTIQTNAQNFEWAFKIGGAGTQAVSKICVDPSGNIIIGGIILGNTDFDPGPAAVNITIGSAASKAYVAKYTAAGTFVWVKVFFVNGEFTAINNICCDAEGNIMAVGDFSGVLDIDPGTPVNNITSAGYKDGFAVKLNSSGEFVWGFGILGSEDFDSVTDVCVDGLNNVYL